MFEYTRREMTSSLNDLAWRNAGDGSPFITMKGHAAVFNRLSDPLFDRVGEFREWIEPGAFRGVLDKSPDVRLLIDHLSHTVLARTPNTLELSETDHGLKAWAKMPAELREAQDARVRMEHGLLNQMSFGFTIEEQRADGYHEDGLPKRAITRVGKLFDVSLVTYPAYPDTDASLRMWVPAGAQMRRDYSKAEREEMAKKGWALPDGSFPIANREDLENAIHLWGHASDPAAAKRHIIKRAKALGLTNLLPEDWGVKDGDGDADDRSGARQDEPGRTVGSTATPLEGSAGASATRSQLALMKLRARRCVIELGLEPGEAA